MESILEDLRFMCKGEIENWKHDILKKGMPEKYPDLKRYDLKLNTQLGPYTEDQLETVVKFVMKKFPKEKDDYKWYILFPKAVARMTTKALNISVQEANNMRSKSFLVEDEIVKEFETTSAKRAKKCKQPNRDKIRGTVPEGMKRPNYRLEENYDRNILNPNYMLTDREIIIGQNLLRKRFPAMNGLMSTTLPKAP